MPEGKCVPIKRPEFHQPDPLIYSQFYLMSLGLAVTWDNPDIVLQRGGVPVPSAALQPDTEYEIVARIWNNSPDAPVASLPIFFSFLSFGVGTISTFIGNTAVNLGVKGGPNHPAFARMKWRTPKTKGHYCIDVFLAWLDDANPNNNLGQENLQVGVAHSPADFVFSLRNAGEEWHKLHFEMDSYTIPEPPPCQDLAAASFMKRSDALVRHRRESYPVPQGWKIEFDPVQPKLAPKEEAKIQVRIIPVAGFIGTQAINVNAFHESGFVGGVTLIVVGG